MSEYDSEEEQKVGRSQIQTLGIGSQLEKIKLKQDTGVRSVLDQIEL